MINIQLTYGWSFWLIIVILIVILLLIWWYHGGENHEFIPWKEGSTPIAEYFKPNLDFSNILYDTTPSSKQLHQRITSQRSALSKQNKRIQSEEIKSEQIQILHSNQEKKSNNRISSYRSSNYIPSIQDKKKSKINIINKKPIIYSNLDINNNEENVDVEKIIANYKYSGESKGESLTRKYLTEIYKVPFIKARPDFLKNPTTGRNLELDCYNEELSIAAEFQGQQHYKYPNSYHKTVQEFIKQKEHDLAKIDMCDWAGIYLITVPYNIPHNKLKQFIIYHLPENVLSRMNNEN